MRRKALGGLLDGLALALLVLYLGSALPAAASIARFMLGLPARAAHESLPTARARLFGGAYAAGIDALRRTLPPGRPYILVAGDVFADGGAFWVRWDLAPRPPLFLGQLDRLTDAAGLRRALGGEPRRLPVVVAWADRPPVLLDGDALLRWIARRADARGGGAAPPVHAR